VLPELNAKKIWVALVIAFWCCAGTARLHSAVDSASLTNFDVRATTPRKAIRAEQKLGHEKLKQSAPGTSADFDPVLNTPKWVHAGGGFLTGENGEGKAVSRETAKKFEGDPDKALKAFLHDQRDLFRHGPEVLNGAVKKRDHATKFLRTVAWEQQLDGIPVFDSVLVANTTGQGELISVSSLFLPEPSAAADKGTPGRVAKAGKPDVTAERALRIAAENLGETIAELSALDEAPAPRTLKQKFQVKPLPGEASASLVWFPLDGDTLRLCWDVELTRRERSERFRLAVDAQNGAILLRRKLTVEVGDAAYRIFTSDSPSPFSPGLAFPTNVQPPLVPRDFLVISNLNGTASPLGWINDGVNETRGNNVDASTDRDGDDRPDLPRPQAGTNPVHSRVFDFPIDFSQHPTNYSAASVVQLFYWCNWMHDKLYELGFTESAGNFQKDNFGRGGADNDAVVADAQDGSGFNNANFTPTRDGSPARIQMFLFNVTSPFRDGDLDAEVVLHEYAHGLSDRLIGGGAGIGQLQTFGMGEGWSDFYAGALLAEFGDDLGGNYAMGGYVTYLLNGLTANYYYGIRRYPYTTNLNVDPLTFKDIDPLRASTHPGIPRNPIVTSGPAEVHRQGEVWCTMLWDMRAYLLRKYAPTNAADYTNANMRVLRYVTLGLQLSPPNPNFLQARDAILQAVRVLQGGSDTNEVWKAFARRGLGLSAVCPDSSTTIGVSEGYDTPTQPEFDIQPQSTIIFTGFFGGPFLGAATNTTLVNFSSSNLSWLAGANVPWLQLSPPGGVLAPGTSFNCVASLSPFASTLPVGTYPGTVFFTNMTRTQLLSRPVLLSVQASNQEDPMIVFPTSTLSLQGPQGGPFIQQGGSSSAPQRVQRITNKGEASFWWGAFTTNTWLGISPSSNLIGPPPEFHEATIALTPAASALPEGTYEGAVTFVNSNSGARVNVPVSLRVGRVDYLTEQFLPNHFDLQNSTLTFTPNLTTNFYRICRQPALQFPTDPSGGIPVTLTDDAFQQVVLTNNRQVSLYGISSNALFIGANGHVTFDPVIDTNFFYPGLDSYFAAGRAAALYVDLNPATGGAISYLQLSNRFVVTYQDVPEFGVSNVNNAQIELFYDGAIRMTWLRVDATNGQSIITGLSRGGGQPPDFVVTDLSASDTCGQTGTLLLPLSAVEGDGSLQGTILLSAPATNDLFINLESSDPNELVVPDLIVMTPGQTSFQFGLHTVDDGEADGTQLVTVRATFSDRPSAEASVLVDDAQSSAVTISIRPTGREGDILVAGGTVHSEAVAVRPLTVSLSSDNTDRARVPLSVVIPAGQDSATFDIVLPENNLIEEAENVAITASVVNWTGDLDAIRVTDNESRQLMLTLPIQVVEGQAAVTNGGRVRFAGLPVTNVVVALQTDIPGLITVPAFVTNSMGTSNTLFTVGVGNNAVTNGFDQIRVFASAPGFLSATGSIIIVDDERPFEANSPTPANFAVDVRRNSILSWVVNSNAPNTTIYDVYISTNADLSSVTPVLSTTNRSATLPFELDPETTYYWRVTARLAPFPPVPSQVWQFTTTPLGFVIGQIEPLQFTGEPFPLSVRASDKFGLTVTNYNGSVALTNFARAESSSTIVISEIEMSALRSIEFQNVADHDVNIAGWKLVYYDVQNWPGPTATFTFPGPAVSPPGSLFFLRILPPQLTPGAYPNFGIFTNILWSNNENDNPVAVMLLDNLGNVVDFVCAFGAEAALISNPRTVFPEQWSGPPAPPNLNAAFTLQRFGNRDSNRSNDWRVAARNTGTNNFGLVQPFTNTTPVAFSGPQVLGSFISGVSTASVTVLEPALGLTFGVRENSARPNPPGALSNPVDVFARNDIAIRLSAPHDVLVGEPVSYLVTVTNTGPLSASSVTVTSVVSMSVAISSATPSQGACVILNGAAICNLGQLDAGAIATVAVLATPSVSGMITNVATVARGEPDAHPGNNVAAGTTRVAFPQVGVADVTVPEPGGPSAMTFNVRLSSPYSQTCSVSYATSDGTATSGIDYDSVSGLVVFPPGSTNQIITIPIYGDVLQESNETFFVTLSNPTNVDITRPVAVGTISDNDPFPQVSVFDTTVVEGNSGTVSAVFNIRLNLPSGRIVTVTYGTASGTALAGFDYVETYGSVVFAPGVTNRTVNVPVLGDTTPEPTKAFAVVLTSAGNGVIVRPQGVGTILDDDVSPLNHFTFDVLAGTNYSGTLVPFTLTARDGSGAVATDFNGPVTLLASVAPRTVAIGTNVINWGLPLAASFHDARLQSIYLTNEVAEAGRVLGLALDMVTPPAQTLSNFTIRMRHTPLDRHVASAWESNWTVVCQRDVTLVTTGWTYFAFSTPFDYSGRENLMLDFSFDNSSFSTDGICRSSPTVGNRSLYLRTDSAYGRPTDWPLDGLPNKPSGTAIARVPNVRLFMDANIPVNVTVSNGFVNGIWSGAVSVPAGAHDLVLRAVDDDGHSGVSDPFTMVQLRIASVSRSGSGIEIRFETLAGSHYIVQTSSSPVGPWSNASGILTGDGTPIQFLHSPSGTAFYRVTLVPATP
jgi:uncharacterized repeat protein (TIGR01451 family)